MKNMLIITVVICFFACNGNNDAKQPEPVKNTNNGHGIIIDSLNDVDAVFISEVQQAYNSNILADLAKDNNHTRLFNKTKQRQEIIDNLLSGVYQLLLVNRCDIMVIAGTKENPEFIYQLTFPESSCQ